MKALSIQCLVLCAALFSGVTTFAETGEHLSGFVVLVSTNRCVPKAEMPGPVDPTRCIFGLADQNHNLLSDSIGGTAKNDGRIQAQLAQLVGRPVCLSGHSDEDDFVIRTVSPGQCTR
jgi:hypothetical protein